jgi:hypothetical protein
VDVDGAADAVVMKIDQLDVAYMDVSVHIRADANLSVEADSRRLAEQQLEDCRQWQAWQERHHLWLAFLRDEVFSDAALAQIWWLQQSPELISAIGQDAFARTTAAVKVAQSERRSGQEAIVHTIEEFVARIAQDERRWIAALQLLDKMLDRFGYSDLRDSLHQLTASPSVRANMSAAELAVLPADPPNQEGAR